MILLWVKPLIRLDSIVGPWFVLHLGIDSLTYVSIIISDIACFVFASP